jgi:hypothetical protein
MSPEYCSTQNSELAAHNLICMKQSWYWLVFLSLFLAVTCGAGISAQIQYAVGQNVAPAFEGWQQNPDGTYSFYFGYLNRNYEEQLDIPIGPNNNIEPGGDRGQPTHFYPRRQRFVFKVTVPKDWDKQQRVIWTLTSHGRTDQAKGWLQPEWELNEEVISENNGGGVLEAGNEPPSITGSSAETVTLPNTLTLTITANDDGIPKPRPRRTTTSASGDRSRRERGLLIKWILYRGPGNVRFDPDTSPDSYGKPVTFTSKVTFSVPGNYVLQATASDGQLSTKHNVTVTVNPK